MKSAFARLAVLVVISLACPMLCPRLALSSRSATNPVPHLPHDEGSLGRRIEALHAAGA